MATTATNPAAGTNRPDAAKGRNADTPAQIPGAGWKDIALRTWKESSKDNVSLVAAGVAFYGFLAMVPLLGATVITYGLIASPETVLRNMQSLATSLPKDVAQLVGDELMSAVKSSGGKKGFGLLLALALALWGARNAASSIVIALNIAYEEEEKRSWLKITLLSLEITAATVVLAMVGGAVVGAMSALNSLLPSLGPVAVVIGKVFAFAVLGAVAAGAAATLYRYGPSRTKAKWTWITPGSALFAVGWVVLTLGFGFYVSHFGKYNVTYGSLGGVIVLVTWLYLSSFILLFGAEFNSEVEHQTARDTTTDAGEKPLGTRGAWSADHVADGPDDAGKEAAQGQQPGQQQRVSDDAEPVFAGPIAPPRPQGWSAARENAQDQHPYLASRATNRAASFAGLGKIGMVSSILSTLGLSMLRRKGRETAGAALLVTAAGLSLWKRED